MPAGRTKATIVGIIVAVAFTILSGVQLESQGLYYDEIHQAPAAFFHLGNETTQFTNYSAWGIPILNMTYSGAIKSNIYGLYLKFISPRFTVRSWRLLGIIFVAIGLLAFYRLAGAALPLTANLLFGLLVLSDVSILLMTRHDWGPVALSLALRLIFLGAWLSIELSEPANWKHFAAGLIVGIAVFEKLSAIVLLVPFCIFVAAAFRRPQNGWTGGITAIGGFVLGTLPLILVNLAWANRGRGLISLTGYGEAGLPFHFDEALDNVYQYLSLAQGSGARTFILGESSSPLWQQFEAIFVLALVVGIVITAYRLRRNSPLIIFAGWLAVSYLLIGVAVYMLPQLTSMHHWALGTPFHYAAIALALPALRQSTWGKAAVWIAAVALLAGRVPSFIQTERSLSAGKASSAFDPVFTRIAEIAAAKSKESAFVAADWGTGTQLYCMGNAQRDFVYEPFWSGDPRESIRTISQNTGKANLYLIVTGLGEQFAESTESISQFMSTSRGWREVAPEPEFTSLSPIRVRKFVRNHE